MNRCLWPIFPHDLVYRLGSFIVQANCASTDILFSGDFFGRGIVCVKQQPKSAHGTNLVYVEERLRMI